MSKSQRSDIVDGMKVLRGPERDGNEENGGGGGDEEEEREFRPPILSCEYPAGGKTPGAQQQVFARTAHMHTTIMNAAHYYSVLPFSKHPEILG